MAAIKLLILVDVPGEYLIVNRLPGKLKSTIEFDFLKFDEKELQKQGIYFLNINGFRPELFVEIENRFTGVFIVDYTEKSDVHRCCVRDSKWFTAYANHRKLSAYTWENVVLDLAQHGVHINVNTPVGH